MYERIISRLYGTPLFLSEAKADAIASAVTKSLFSGTLRVGDFNPTAAPVALSEELRVSASTMMRAAASDSGSYSESALPRLGLVYVLDALATRHAAGASSSGISYSGIQSKIESMLSDGVNLIGFIHHSPGGEAAGMTALMSEISSLTEQGVQTFSYVEGMAASAAYGLAAATQQIYATESSVVGSIGAVIIHADQSEADAKAGVKYEIFRSREEKALGDSHSPLPEAARTHIEETLKTFDGIFVEAVLQNRPALTAEAIDNLKGSTVMGVRAVELGLADTIVANFNQVLQLELQRFSQPKSESKSERGTQMLTPLNAAEETRVIGAAPAPAPSAGFTAADVQAAVLAERARAVELLTAGTTLRLDNSSVLKALEKGWAAEMALEVFTTIAEARQPVIDGKHKDETVSLVDSTELAAGAPTQASLLSAYEAATGFKA